MEKRETVTWRLKSLVVIYLFFIGFQLMGIYVNMSLSDAERLVNLLREKVSQTGTTLDTYLTIIKSNGINDLIMCIPFAGPVYGFMASFATGMAVKAVSIVQHVDPYQLYFSILLTPFAPLEFLGFSIGINASVVMAYSILKKIAKAEINHYLFQILLSIICLTLAALIETIFIEFYSLS
ncbi:hypothetical protein B6U74_05290 [Candidatus Bathyarchaeota archaeon ex4484_205]|nr:MAG: hypothetical protein B6U74_05290 [Candidatus Bathyarchaeota archaeon ex4484_205]